jgi:tRNA modification GTPase
VFSTADTIVATATPQGRGGIGVVRISGAGAREVAAGVLACSLPLQPRHATLTHTRLTPGHGTPAVADQVVATFFPMPHSYTGEDVVEISAHGSPVVLHAIVHAATGRGARLARPGEFTLRAFLHGKLNLVEAEAVADLIEAATPLQARLAFDQLQGTLTKRIARIDEELFDLIARLEASLDFPDEGFHFVERDEVVIRIREVIANIDSLLAEARQGRTIRDGATVVITGRPNVGKSSLYNKLLGSDRAIVTDVPGTTRDLVTERLDLDGLLVTIVDTAGFHETTDVVEREGLARAAGARAVADLVLVVLDLSEGLTSGDQRLLNETETMRRLVVANKCDRPARARDSMPAAWNVSAITGEGLRDLRAAIVAELMGSEQLRDTAALSNQRHIALVESARAHLVLSVTTAGTAPEEFVLIDLQAGRACFDEIVGTRTSEDVLRHIFDRFCIGK